MTPKAIHWSERTKAFLAILFWLAAAGMMIWLATVDPARLESGRRVCLFQNITGHECPGCGTTRAISALLHGHPGKAVQYNVFVIIVFPLLALVGIKSSIKSLSRAYRVLFSREERGDDAHKCLGDN